MRFRRESDVSSSTRSTSSTAWSGSASGAVARPAVLVRVTPGIEAHTHEYVRTGQDDSKFGFGLASGAADEGGRNASGTRRARSSWWDFTPTSGRRCSPLESFEKSVAVLAEFFLPLGLRRALRGGWSRGCLRRGGGSPLDHRLGERRQEGGLASGVDRSVRITAEPGRSIVASAAITCYTVGTVEGHPGRPDLRERRRGHERQPAAGPLRQRLRGISAGATGRRPPRADRHRGRQALRIGRRHRPRRAAALDVTVGDVVATPGNRGVRALHGIDLQQGAPTPGRLRLRDGGSRLVVRRETPRRSDWPSTSETGASAARYPRGMTTRLRVGLLGCGNVGGALASASRRGRDAHRGPHRARPGARCRRGAQPVARAGGADRSRLCSPPTRPRSVLDPDSRRGRRGHRRDRAGSDPDPGRPEVRASRWSPPTRSCWPTAVTSCSRRRRRPGSTCSSRPRWPAGSRSSGRFASPWPGERDPPGDGHRQRDDQLHPQPDERVRRPATTTLWRRPRASDTPSGIRPPTSRVTTPRPRPPSWPTSPSAPGWWPATCTGRGSAASPVPTSRRPASSVTPSSCWPWSSGTTQTAGRVGGGPGPPGHGSPHPSSGVGARLVQRGVRRGRRGRQLMFLGRGAGGMPTASAVLGDLLDAAHNLTTGGAGRTVALRRTRSDRSTTFARPTTCICRWRTDPAFSTRFRGSSAPTASRSVSWSRRRWCRWAPPRGSSSSPTPPASGTCRPASASFATSMWCARSADSYG